MKILQSINFSLKISRDDLFLCFLTLFLGFVRFRRIKSLISDESFATEDLLRLNYFSLCLIF